MPDLMKAISLHQPWASAVALGFKHKETRSWPTEVRGLIAIHAAKKRVGRAGTITHYGYETSVMRDEAGYLLRNERLSHPYRLPLGALVAVATLYDCRRADSIEVDADERERAWGDFSPGRYAWMLGNIRPLRQEIPAKGRQGWWSLNDDQVRRVCEQLELVS